MRQRTLPLDPEQLPAPLGALDDEALGRAGQEVGDDGVDGDPPPRDRDPRLAGRNEDGLQAAVSRGEVKLDGHRFLADRTVRADGEDDLRRHLQVLAGRHVEIRRRLAEVAELDAMLLRERAELRILADELMEAALEVEPGVDARLQQLAPGGRETPALRCDADG